MSRFTSYLNKRILLEPEGSTTPYEHSTSRWRSEDLNPVPRSQKKWEWYHVGGFWIAEGFSAAQVQAASAAVAVGLNPGLALVAYFIGNLMLAVACCGSGYIGSKNSVNFPVVARAAFGMWGSFLAIVIRMAVAPIWFGIQGYIGGLAVEAMIQAIWPSFAEWHQDGFPPSVDITPSTLLGCAIFWLLQLPLLYLSTQRLRWVFIAKIILMPLLWVALFTWALTASNGFGPLLYAPSKPMNGMSTGYLFCYAITASTSGGNFALAATSQVIYGQIYWNPLEMIKIWDNRAAKFFAALFVSYYLLFILSPFHTCTDVEDEMAWAIEGHKSDQTLPSRSTFENGEKTSDPLGTSGLPV
ncbi:MAG: hypothetical protein Q9166_000075 [cf. Caloplaca sp. 2 TL-2023]